MKVSNGMATMIIITRAATRCASNLDSCTETMKACGRSFACAAHKTGRERPRRIRARPGVRQPRATPHPVVILAEEQPEEPHELCEAARFGTNLRDAGRAQHRAVVHAVCAPIIDHASEHRDVEQNRHGAEHVHAEEEAAPVLASRHAQAYHFDHEEDERCEENLRAGPFAL